MSRKSSTLEDIQNKFINHYGYDPYNYLSNYINYNTKLKIQCKKCGNIFESTPTNLLSNIKLDRDPYCKECNKSKTHDKTAYSEKYKNDLIAKYGNRFSIMEDYQGIDIKILHKCNECGYQWKISPNNILHLTNGKCPKCNNKVRSELSYEERLQLINDGKIINIEPYINRRTKILHKCNDCGYEWKALPNNLLKGSGCPRCSHINTQSESEKELINFLKENYKKEILIKSRKILNGKELDIYFPEEKLAIEIDGLYWHSDKFKDKNYHLEKTEECEKNGIRLIHIFEDELDYKKDIVYSKIKHLLNLNKDLKKIYARNCYVKNINSKDKNLFLNENHIQGSDKSCINLGLFYNDELVSVMTFCRPRNSLNGNNKFDYELSRFSNKNCYIVLGSFGKLFSYFEKNYEFNSIITYADRRWSNGNLYYKNGFELDHISKPNYWYYNTLNKKRYHRYNFRKSELKKKFPELYNENLTEIQIMNSVKRIVRVYDCGNFIFVLKKNLESYNDN